MPFLGRAITGEPRILPGTVNQYWRGDKTWQTFDKTVLGLANVDNTSDADKPLSTAAVTALAAKMSLTGTQTVAGDKTFTGQTTFESASGNHAQVVRARSAGAGGQTGYLTSWYGEDGILKAGMGPSGELLSYGGLYSPHTTGSADRTRSPGAMVRKTDAPTVTSGAYTLVSWTGHWSTANQDATVWDTAQPSRFYAPVSGRYAISGGVVFGSHATGYRIFHVRINSAGSQATGTSLMFWTTAAVNGTVTSIPFAMSDIYLVAGDYIEGFVNQTSGTALVVGSISGVTPTFTMSYIGPV